jgi:hypothetical protein
MKWKRKHRRIIKRFAFFPISIGDAFVWLETAYIRQRFYRGILYSWWEDVDFVTKEDYEEYKKGKKDEQNQLQNL